VAHRNRSRRQEQGGTPLEWSPIAVVCLGSMRVLFPLRLPLRLLKSLECLLARGLF
jgi:hypothetical protein